MPRALVEDSSRHALAATRQVIEDDEPLKLSERDSLRVLDVLGNPPAPTAKLLAASHKLPRGGEPARMAGIADRECS